MITIKKARSFKLTVPVKIEDPETPDKAQDATFVAEFKSLQRRDIEDLQAKKLDDRQFCERVLLGVSGIGGEDGEPYPANEQRALVIEDLGLCRAALKAFNDHYSTAKAGN